MTTVYLLYHFHKFDDAEVDQKLIWVYSSEARAQEAIDRFKDKPGFRDIPEGFEIFPHQIERHSWTKGFISAEEALEAPTPET